MGYLLFSEVTINEEEESMGTPLEELIQRLDKDLKKSAAGITSNEARFLVDAYYTMQGSRIDLAGKLRSHNQRVDDQPAAVLQWFFDNISRLEKQIALALKYYAENNPTGAKSMTVCGIGPVLAAGLLAHIDMNKAKTPGHIYSFAGYDPRRRWVGKAEATKIVANVMGKNKKVTRDLADKIVLVTGGNADTIWDMTITDKDGKGRKPTKDNLISATCKRPWNGSFKTFCWKIGESFVKVSGNKNDFYGKLYKKRREEEGKNSDAGVYKQQAADILAKVPNHVQKAIYSQGKLPDGHLHSRAKRWTVKLFLSHWWEQAYEDTFGKKPTLDPYAIAHLGHVHKIKKPW